MPQVLRNLRVFFLLIVPTFLTFSLYFGSYSYSGYLLRSLVGPIEYNDPELIRYIRENVLEPPSNLPYNLKKKDERSENEKFYDTFTRSVLGFKQGGFFVEAGAMDGQTLSNTLDLEVKQSWTGLLVEPDPSNYVLLKKKRRKAWLAKACLSIQSHPVKEKLSSFNSITRTKSHRDLRERAMGKIVFEKNNSLKGLGFPFETLEHSYYERVCFPLGSLLLALNVTRVDLLCLDLEGVEEFIIRHFDFRIFDVQVVYMEWWQSTKLVWLKDFMEENGFQFVDNTLGDIIFVKKNSEAHSLVIKKALLGNLTIFV